MIPELQTLRPLTRLRSAAALLLSFISLTACGSSSDLGDAAESNARARAILDSVQLAAGGAENLAGVRTLAVQYVHTRFDVPNRDDNAAARPQSIDVIQVRDFENGRQFYERRAAGPNGAWERVVIVPGAAFRVDLHTNETTVFMPDAASAALYSGLEFRWYVYSALSDALFSTSSLRQRPDTTMGSQGYHVLSFDGAGTETNELLVDLATHRLVRRRLEVSDPITGRAETTIEYHDYADVGGLPMPMTVDVLVNGRPFERFEMQDIRINAQLQDGAFEPPSQ